MWICNNALEQTACPASFYAATTQEWTMIPKGSSAPIPFTYPTAAPSVVQCIKNPTTAPTTDPSESPTNNPSKQPTRNPSNNPSTNPTKQPSINPTNQPSNNPSTNQPSTNQPSTKQPSMNPTNQPSNNPSNNPSVSPSNNPSISPSNNPSKMPSKTPTNIPTTTPSTIPTDNPSKSPSNQPTHGPSDAPVASGDPSKAPTTQSSHPTIAPSENPSYSPSINPSYSPSKIPSETPSNNPSITPTKVPSKPPSKAPTKVPSHPPSTSPTRIPTAAPTVVTFKVDAEWSDTYLSIDINIKNNDPGNATIQLRYNSVQTKEVSWATNCGYYFDLETLYTIGIKSTCNWRVNPTVLTHENDIGINLIYSSDVSPPNITLNSSLTIRSGAFEFRYIQSTDWEILNESLLIDFIFPALNPVEPNIRSKVRTFLGICDSLILDASSTQNLGGRQGDYFWQLNGPIVDPNNNYSLLYNRSNFTDNTQEFMWNELIPKTTLDLSLNISSWFGQNNYAQWSIYKDNKPQPQIILDGPTLFSISNDNYDGIVILTALIGFDDSCLKNNTANLPFKLEWTVQCTQCNNLIKLQSLLNIKSIKNNGKTDVISFIALDYLEVSASYIFTVNMTCIDNLECNTISSLTMSYIFSEITCQITNADMYIYDIAREDFLNYNSLYLDGNTFTYDPDEPDKSNLIWNWKCTRNSYAGSTSCDHLLYDSLNAMTSTTDNAIYVHFGEDNSLEYNQQYLYTFTMTVYDTRNMIGRQCIDSANLVVGLLGKSADIDWISLNIEIIAASLSINIAEKLRLVVIWNAINNPDNINFTDPAINITFKWTENSNQLSSSKIEELNQNNNAKDNGNLIIEPGQLEPGIYQFNITISIYYESHKKGESSSSEEIIIKQGAYITLFDINPDCDNVTYYQLSQIFETKYTMIVSANDNGDPPLVYGFSYKFIDDKEINDKDDDIEYITYLQSQLLNRPRLEKILLPIGDFDINAHVFDADGTPSISTIQCSIKLDENYDWKQNSDHCLSYKQVLINYFNVSTIRQPFEIRKFIIYTSDIYINYILNDILENDLNLEYLYEYELEDYECVKTILSDTLNTTHEYFNYDDHIFCGNDYSVILSSLMRKWFDLRILVNFYDFTFRGNPNGNNKYSRRDIIINYNDYDHDSLDIEIFKINSLIEQILDPCDYITENIKQLKLLSVESESIITNQRVIYYKNKDITHQLSPLLLEYEKYGKQLYQFTESIINLLSEIAEIDKNDYYLNVIVDIIDLITKSLYIAQLSRISVAIAGENTYITSSNGEFEITSIRYGSTSSNGINLTTPNFDVLITDKDLLQYLEECENDNNIKNKALCNGDVIILGFNTTKSNNTQFDGYNVGDKCEEYTGFGELGTNELEINIVGQNVTDLDNNVTMTFNEGYDPNDIPVCVWWNNNTLKWDESGCITNFSISTGSVTCSCNHLTTFATIHELNTRGICAISDEFHYVSLIFIILFICIITYIICSIYPFYKRGKRKFLCSEKAIIVFQLILTISIVNVVVCLFFFIVDNEKHDDLTEKGLIDFQIILLVLPLFIYFVIFGLILYSWATVAHSLQVQDEQKLRFRLRFALYSSLSIVSIALIIQIVLVPMGLFKDEIEQISLLFWCGLLAVSALLYSIYGFLMVKLLVNTAKKMRNVVKTGAGSDMSLAKKLLISAVCIWLFFILELIINLMFTFKWVQFTPWWRSFDLALNFFCLLIICYMYHASVKRLRKMNKATTCCDKPQKSTQIASKTKDTTNARKNVLKSSKRHKSNTSNISVPGPSHRQLSSTSEFSNTSNASITPAIKKRLKKHKQISCVTITEVTELSNLNHEKSTQLIMKYDENKRVSDVNLDAPRLSALGASQTWDDDDVQNDEDIVIDESLDMNHVNSALQQINDNNNNQQIINNDNNNNNNMLPPPLPPQYTIDSNSEYEYEYYEEDDDGNQFETNPNILFAE